MMTIETVPAVDIMRQKRPWGLQEASHDQGELGRSGTPMLKRTLLLDRVAIAAVSSQVNWIDQGRAIAKGAKR